MWFLVCCVESYSVWNDIIKFFFFNLETILVATKADLKKGIVNRHTRASSDPNVRPGRSEVTAVNSCDCYIKGQRYSFSVFFIQSVLSI